MKYSSAALLLFFSVLTQASFLRLINFLPFAPDMPLIVLFILSYRFSGLSFIILAAFTGALIDLFGAAYFGISIFAAMAAFSANLLARENIFKGKTFGSIVLSGLSVFIFFYLFLFSGSRLLGLSGENNFIFNLFDKKTGIEIILNSLIAACLAHFLEGKKSYANIQDKISA